MPFSVIVEHKDAILPRKSRPEDAGYDLFALTDITLGPWAQMIVDTGVTLAGLPDPPLPGWRSVLQIWPRSGMDAKFALHTGAGIVDYLYRGQILVLLKNQSDSTIVVEYGTAIAQAVIVPCYVGEVLEVSEATATSRGATGGIASARRY